MVRGITFNLQRFKSKDFALMTKRFFNNNDGILTGCNITTSSNNILIDSGWFLTSGYYTSIEEREVISASASGTLVYEIDLTKENTEAEFNQGSFKIIEGDPIQEDLFNGGSIYQCPFATVEFSNGVITGLNQTIGQLTGDTLTTAGGNVDGTLDVTSLYQSGNKIPNFFSGTTNPDDSLGEEGDIFIKY